MIQEIKIKNFLSFKEETTFSFVAQNNDTFAEESQVVRKNDGTRLLRFAVIYGYNASGKSNLLGVLDFLKAFWGRKADDPEEETMVIPFKMDEKSKKEHSVFEIIFYVGEKKYWYQLELDDKKVYLEKLSYYKTSQPTMLFERIIEKDKTKIKFGSYLKLSSSARELIELNCLKNISFFVARNQVNVDIPLVDEAKEWLRKCIMETIDPRTRLTSYAMRKIQDNSPLVKHLLGFLAEADFNISNVETRSKKEPLPEEVLKKIREDDSVPESIKGKIMKDGTLEKLETFFSHTVINKRKKEKYLMTEEDESVGTLRTFGLETAIYEVIRKNGLLAIDEIETSLHPKLLETILFGFLKDASDSQIIATTHNDGLLDLVDDLIRKDSVWFVEKKENGESDLYRLTDFRGVNRLSSIRTAYRNKRFGATQFSTRV